MRPSSGLALAAILLTPATALAAPEVGVPARDAALLMSGEQGGGLPIEAAVRFEAGAEGPAAVVSVDVPAWPLLELAGTKPLPLLLAVYAVDADGALAGSTTERFRVATAGLTGAGASGLRLSTRLALRPGELSVRVLVRAGTEAAEFGLRKLPLEVPAVDGGPEWLAIELPSDRGRWLAAPGGPGAAPSPVLPVVASADRLDIELLARGRPVRVPVIELVSGGPRLPESEVESVPVELRDLERLGGGAGGWSRFRARLTLPRLADGRYRLRFQPPAGGQGQEIVVARAGAEAVSWADLVRPTTERAEPIQGGNARPRPAAAERHLDEAVKRFTSAGAGDVGPLEKLFLDEWQRAGAAGTSTLVEAGNRLAWDVAAIEPEALVPLAAASADLYRRFLDGHQWALSTAARRMTVIFLDVYSRGASGGKAQGSSAGDRTSVAADGWASFAGDLLQSGLLGHAAALYKRALEINPRQTESLLVLAAIYERAAEYDKAAAAYRRLLEISPSDAELRLRMAVQQARIGQPKDARRRLGGLLDEQPDWVALVAAQELARLDLDSGRPAEASQILGAALARHPHDEKLLLFRAALDELSGDGRVSAESLAALGEEPARRAPSARHRYAAWPPAALGEARVRLAAAADQRREALDRALRGSRR